MALTLMKGSEAIAEAAIRAGARYFFGYPITPQTEIPEYMSARMPEVGGCFLQAESEVAAINMIYGAAGAGARALTSSSSPGVSLKQEGISYCAGAQLPAVILNVMRGGPGLGNIQASQGDYFQAVKGGGNGDYHLLTFAPASVQEAIDLMMIAYDKAEKYRIPVLFLADGIIAQMMEPVEMPEMVDYKIDPEKKPWACTGWKPGDDPAKRGVINSIYIGLATFIGVKVMKFSRLQSAVPERAKRMRRLVYTLAILTLLPSIYLTYNMLTRERFEMNANRFVAEECKFPNTQVLSHSAFKDQGEKEISITLIGKVLPQDSLELALANRLQYYGLSGVKLNIIQGDAGERPDMESMVGHSVNQIYTLAQNALVQKQEAIDSLRQIIDNRRERDSISAQLAPELKVIYPQISEIAITRAVFGQISTGSLDTANIALIRYNRPISTTSKAELQRYLEARLKVPSIRLVNVD